MSLNLVKKNSASPFKLQRSIVDQGGEGGAYEQGGYNPDIVYNNDGFNTAIESFGKIIGAALGSRTAEGKNKSDVKTKERLDKKEKAIKDDSWKNLGNDRMSQRDKSDKKLARIDKKQERVESRIVDYNKSKNPLAGSETLKNLDAAMAKKPEAIKAKEAITAKLFNPKDQSTTSYSNNANLEAPKKIAGPKENVGPVFFDYKKAQKEDFNNKLKFFGK